MKVEDTDTRKIPDNVETALERDCHPLLSRVCKTDWRSFSPAQLQDAPF
jgi:hypothetical protein